MSVLDKFLSAIKLKNEDELEDEYLDDDDPSYEDDPVPPRRRIVVDREEEVPVRSRFEEEEEESAPQPVTAAESAPKAARTDNQNTRTRTIRNFPSARRFSARTERFTPDAMWKTRPIRRGSARNGMLSAAPSPTGSGISKGLPSWEVVTTSPRPAASAGRRWRNFMCLSPFPQKMKKNMNCST